MPGRYAGRNYLPVPFRGSGWTMSMSIMPLSDWNGCQVRTNILFSIAYFKIFNSIKYKLTMYENVIRDIRLP